MNSSGRSWRRVFRVVIYGPMGAGKTTLVGKLSSLLGDQGVAVMIAPELTKETEKAVEIMGRVKIPATRLYFQAYMNGSRGIHLLSLLDEAQKRVEEDNITVVVIQDQSIGAQKCYAQAQIRPEEIKGLDLITGYLDWAEKDVPKPDVRVFLWEWPEELLRRIQSRGRSGEEWVDLRYIRRLLARFKELTGNYVDDASVPTLDLGNSELSSGVLASLVADYVFEKLGGEARRSLSVTREIGDKD